ncbi:hypothetical protein N1851_020024 [Merluccius polli]|uniref:Uncharacterized protein n=1 Tax=Merluccius polli TaxID=89951 RepID=A0AA47MLH4_MERPO|nr:hypothetical protein N1851_020024 [Merluccius polli]
MTSSSGLLSTAQDWELKVDLGMQLKFPNVAVTTLRPDLVLPKPQSRSSSWNSPYFGKTASRKPTRGRDGGTLSWWSSAAPMGGE